MRKLIAALFVLLASLGVAHAQAGCTPQSQATNLNALRDSQAAGSITPGVIRNLACSTGWNVVVPTNTSADVTNLQAAVNGSQPVFMAAGNWQICSQISVPHSQVIQGAFTYDNPGSDSPNSANSKTIVNCPTNGSFTSGQAYFALQDHDTIWGISIYCNSGAGATFNGINALNAVSVDIGYNSVYFCQEGIDRFSNGSSPGFSHAYSQLAKIHDNLLYFNTDHGYRADFSNGGFVSDELIGPNNDFVGNSLYGNGIASFGIYDNRLEVAGSAVIILNGAVKTTINGNVFEQAQSVLITGSEGIAITGNYGNYSSFGAVQSLEFAGNNTNIQVAGNIWYGSAIYTVDAGGTFTQSTFAENANAPAALFSNAYSQAIIQPLMVTSNLQLTNEVAQNTATSQFAGNHISSRGFTPSLSSCGSGTPSVVGDDSGGAVTLGTGSPTGCTLTFGAPYTYTPQCTATTNSTSSVPDVSAISTAAFTVSLSATATKIFYTCIEPATNYAAAVGSGFTGPIAFNGQSTLTTAAATDPLGGSTAAKLTEDTSTNLHWMNIAATGSATGNYTASAYIHAGSSGTDRIAVGALLSNTQGIVAIFDPTTGNYVYQVCGPDGVACGGASIISTGSQNVGNGWFRVWVTLTLSGSNVPSQISFALENGSNLSYTGVAGHNVELWGPALRYGSLP